MSDVTDKIRKLIALAQSTTNPNEAAAFMNKATELMSANNLDMDTVDLSQIKESEVKSRFSVSKPKDYEITLMSAIASSFGLELLWRANVSWNNEGNYAAIIFVGPKDRLELATYAAEVLGRQLFKARSDFSTKQSNRYWQLATEAGEYASVRECKDDVNGTTLAQMIKKRVTTEANSFAVGWVMEVRKKVSRFALNDREQQLLSQYVNKNVGKDEEGNVKEAKSEDSTLTAASFAMGQAAAKDAHLHRPMGTSAEEVNLLGQTLQIEGGK